MKDIEIYIFLLIALPIISVFAIRRQDEALKEVNKKRRFGVYLTAILFSCLMFFIVALICNIETISIVISIDIKIVVVMILVLSIGLFIIFNKTLFIPISYDRYEKDKAYRKHNFKSWSYYVIRYPASSIKNTLRLPPVSKYSKPDTKLFNEYYTNSLETPPSHIQFLLIIIVYLLTGLGFFISDIIIGEWTSIYINLSVLPFVFIIIFMNELIFLVLKLIEYILNVKMNEVVKFLLFNVIFVLVVDVFVVIIKMNVK